MTDPGPSSAGEAAHAPLHHRTAWHPLLVMLLEMLLPRERWRVLAEFPLTRKPRRIDAVVVRQIAEGAWRPQHLRSVLDDLRAHNVVHFKGATDDLEASDALQLLSYAYQYMALEGITHPDALALRVVAPRLTPRFREQLTLLGGELRGTSVPGVHEGTVQTLTLRVVETAVAWPAPGEHLLYPISPAYLQRPVCPVAFDDTEWALYYRLAQGITRLAQDPNWKAIMKDATQVSDATRQAFMDLLAVIPPEQRLAGLAPEQRLDAPTRMSLDGVYLRVGEASRMAVTDSGPVGIVVEPGSSVPGTMLAVDGRGVASAGVLSDGRATLRQSWITGHSRCAVGALRPTGAGVLEAEGLELRENGREKTCVPTGWSRPGVPSGFP